MIGARLVVRALSCAAFGYACTVGTAVAIAQNVETAEAKEYFKAGAQAYAAGDYQAAIQALEAAYRSTPLPAIAFSLAQAERRQYFAANNRRNLERAVELFRTYLERVAQGGRRTDAIEALSQLEPILAMAQATAEPARSAVIEQAKTRLMVSSEAEGATISLDGATPVHSPLIAEVAPGDHVVTATAQGFFAGERRVVAVAGELVPIELVLRERTAAMVVSAPEDADLYIDGAFVGKGGLKARYEVTKGKHTLAVAKSGYRLEIIDADLHRGETRAITASLHVTGQRTAARVLFVVSAASASAALAFSVFAIHEENDAEEILGRRSVGNIGPAALDEYGDSVTARNIYRTAAITSLGVSAVSLVTGLLFHELDTPNLNEALASPRRRNVPEPALGKGLSLWPRTSDVGLDLKIDF